MIVRQPKRWCDECKQTVFSRGHGHQLVAPPFGRTMMAAAVEKRRIHVSHDPATVATAGWMIMPYVLSA